MQAGMNVNSSDNEGKTAMHGAAVGGHAELMHLLIAAGGDVHAASRAGDTTLHLAADHSNISAVECLLTAGGNSNARGAHGRTPLHAAACSGSAEVAAALLTVDADPTLVLTSSGPAAVPHAVAGNSPVLYVAVQCNNAAIVT
jgi:ankyrin repeat protein